MLGGRGFSRGLARKTEWTSAVVAGQSVAAGPITSITALVLSSFMVDMTSPTLVRTRGEILFTPANVAGTVSGAFGIIEYEAKTSPSYGDIPRPVTEGDASWLYWHALQLQNQTWTDGTVAEAARYEVDSKAMRKCSEISNLVLVIETPVSSIGYNFACAFRFLFKQ